MSNYTTENLIAVQPGEIPAGTPAIKVGDHVFLAGNVSGGEEIYLCVSASDPTYYHINADTYGGDYYRDGDYSYDNGSRTTPVYTNGTHYFMKRQTGTLPGFDWDQWGLYESRNNDSQYLITCSLPYEHASVTSGGQMIMLTPRKLDSGTWTGREMVVNSVGYYEPVASGNENNDLSYTKIVPEAGQMYTADALKHIDEVWNYNYERDIDALVSSYQNAMRPDQSVYAEGISGPDANGWFTLGDGASVTYSGYDEWGGGGSEFKARAGCFTLAFKFKPVAFSGQHTYYNHIIGLTGMALWVTPTDTTSGLLDVSIDAALFRFEDFSSYEKTFSNVTFTAGSEYEIVIFCDGTYCSIIINGVRVVHLIYQSGTEQYPGRNTPMSVTLHGGWDWQWDGCEYQYKELSLWGRVLPELAAHSSSLAVPVIDSSMGSNAVCPQGVTIGSAILNNSGNMLTVAGTVMSAEVASISYAERGLHIMSGGVVSAATVSSGGRMVVYSGGTALNVTSQAGANITVTSGGSISYVQ